MVSAAYSVTQSNKIRSKKGQHVWWISQISQELHMHTQDKQALYGVKIQTLFRRQKCGILLVMKASPNSRLQ